MNITESLKKICSRCKIEKEIAEFNSRPRYRFGVSCRCKQCDSEINRISYAKNIEVNRLKSKEYSASHRKEANLRSRRYYAENQEKFRAYNRANYHKNKERLSKARLKYEYGITKEEYDKLFTEQGGACAICYKVPKITLCVDHNHKNGKVRGLLCKRCNTAIAFLDEDVKVILSAIVYLNKYGNAIGA